MDENSSTLALIRTNWHLSLALLAEMDLTAEQAQRIAASFRKAQEALQVIALNAPAHDAEDFADALHQHTEEGLDAILGVRRGEVGL